MKPCESTTADKATDFRMRNLVEIRMLNDNNHYNFFKVKDENLGKRLVDHPK